MKIKILFLMLIFFASNAFSYSPLHSNFNSLEVPAKHATFIPSNSNVCSFRAKICSTINQALIVVRLQQLSSGAECSFLAAVLSIDLYTSRIDSWIDNSLDGASWEEIDIVIVDCKDVYSFYY